MNATEKAYVELGRKLITLCEKNEIFNGQDEESLTLWNAAVTAGNKLVTYGTTWTRFKSIHDLTELEKKVVLEQIAV